MIVVFRERPVGQRATEFHLLKFNYCTLSCFVDLYTSNVQMNVICALKFGLGQTFRDLQWSSAETPSTMSSGSKRHSIIGSQQIGYTNNLSLN